MASSPLRAARQGEGAHACSRCARRGATPAADGAGREGVRLRRAGRQGDAARPLRGTPTADRLQLHVRPEPGRRLRRLLHGRRPDPPPGASPCPRYLVRARLARADREDRAVPQADGLDDPLVLVVLERLQRRPGRVARGAAGGRVSGRRELRSHRVPPRRRSRLPHVLHQPPRRRGARHRLDVPRPDAARPPGGVGGLPPRLPTDEALRLVAPARRVRERLVNPRRRSFRMLGTVKARHVIALGLVAAALAFGATACGNDDEGSSAGGETTTEQTTTTEETTTEETTTEETTTSEDTT